jgi:microcystin-dependent protein
MDVSTNSVLLGEIKAFHSFNGAISLPRGWMLCDGSVINSTNYDALHGSGTYTSDGVSSLALAGKYTPNLVNKYMVGASSTTQSGASAITSVGNTSHQVNLQHSHSHNHIWYKWSSNGSASTDGAGNALTSSASKLYTAIHANADSTDQLRNDNAYTSTDATNAGSATQSIQPESIAVMYIIRVGL